ncbi:MAG: hypothetical protein JW751_23710 [Polyangiaceae bacterium]|nr:hypothetical protein [Polyangiaceae bacterium]
MQRSQVLLLGLVAGLVAVGGVGAVLCVGTYLFFGALGETQHDLSRPELESVARLRLPPSAANVRSRREGFQDDLVHLRFNMDPGEEALLAGSTCHLGPEADGPPQLFAIEEPWWDAAAVPRHRSCQREGAGFTQVVAVNTANGSRWAVYVVLAER